MHRNLIVTLGLVFLLIAISATIVLTQQQSSQSKLNTSPANSQSSVTSDKSSELSTENVNSSESVERIVDPVNKVNDEEGAKG